MLVQTPDRAPDRPAADYGQKVQDLVYRYIYYRDLLMPRRAEEVRFWRRYYADASLVDTRTEDEKTWRSLIMLPYGYSGIQSLVTQLRDLLLAPSPVLQTTRRGAEDARAAANERLA